MRELEDGSVDAVVTDPPYGISFMAKHWDTFALEERTEKRDVSKLGVRLTGGADSENRKLRPRTGSAYANRAGSAGSYDFTLTGNRAFQTWVEQWSSECLRLLKPGGHALVFGGTRTYHRLASGLEDAGFEIRDCVAWLFGSGFPKSHNLDGDWKGWGTALKPAHEPIVVARKPLAGTVAANVGEHGTGAINVDACRIEGQPHAGGEHAVSIYGSDGNYEPGPNVPGNGLGRWPANVVLDEEAAAMLDEQSGERAAGNHPAVRSGREREKVYGSGWSSGTNGDRRPTESGGASRFFYVAKASRAERNAGLDGFEERERSIGDERPAGGMHERYGDANGSGRSATAQNHHPTVKPIELMRWLVRLVTPPGGTVLDPFLGSGTTGIAAALEDFDFIGIEREAEYLAIAEARIAYWKAQPRQLDLLGETAA